MTRQMSISALKADFYRLVEMAAKGEVIIVTKRGKMRAKLEPITEVLRFKETSDVASKISPDQRRAKPKRKSS
jgi:prevent-host-death family protein